MAWDGVNPNELEVLVRGGPEQDKPAAEGCLKNNICSVCLLCVVWPRGRAGFPRCVSLDAEIADLFPAALPSPSSPWQFKMEIAASSWGLESSEITGGTTQGMGLCPHLPTVLQ